MLNSFVFCSGISEEVAKWMTIAYKNIVGVGVDLPGLDPGSSKMFPAVKTLFNAGLYVVTNIKLDQYLPGTCLTTMQANNTISLHAGLLRSMKRECRR